MFQVMQAIGQSPPDAVKSGKPAGASLQPGESGENFKEVLKKKEAEEEKEVSTAAAAAAAGCAIAQPVNAQPVVESKPGAEIKCESAVPPAEAQPVKGKQLVQEGQQKPSAQPVIALPVTEMKADTAEQIQPSTLPAISQPVAEMKSGAAVQVQPSTLPEGFTPAAGTQSAGADQIQTTVIPAEAQPEVGKSQVTNLDPQPVIQFTDNQLASGMQPAGESQEKTTAKPVIVQSGSEFESAEGLKATQVTPATAETKDKPARQVQSEPVMTGAHEENPVPDAAFSSTAASVKHTDDTGNTVKLENAEQSQTPVEGFSIKSNQKSETPVTGMSRNAAQTAEPKSVLPDPQSNEGESAKVHESKIQPAVDSEHGEWKQEDLQRAVISAYDRAEGVVKATTSAKNKPVENAPAALSGKEQGSMIGFFENETVKRMVVEEAVVENSPEETSSEPHLMAEALDSSVSAKKSVIAAPVSAEVKSEPASPKGGVIPADFQEQVKVAEEVTSQKIKTAAKSTDAKSSTVNSEANLTDVTVPVQNTDSTVQSHKMQNEVVTRAAAKPEESENPVKVTADAEAKSAETSPKSSNQAQGHFTGNFASADQEKNNLPTNWQNTSSEAANLLHTPEEMNPTKPSAKFQEAQPVAPSADDQSSRKVESSANNSKPVMDAVMTGVSSTGNAQLEQKAEAPKITPAHIQQIAQEVKQTVQAGKSDIHIQLHPQDLGTIDIRLTSDSKGVGVTIMTEHASTGRLLESQVDSLRQSLSDAGLNLTQMNFGMKGQGGQSAGQYYQPYSQQVNRSWFQRPWSEDSSLTDAVTAKQLTLTPSRIDLRV